MTGYMREAENSSVNVNDILSIILRRKWLIFIPIIVITGLAWGSTYFLTPEYRSSTIIWIDKPTNVSRELGQLLGVEGRGRESGDDRRRRLKALKNEITSQTYLYQLIRQMQLDEDPEVSREAARMRESNPSFSLEQIKYNILLEQLRSNISVSFVGTDQIELAFVSEDPTKAKEMVSAITEILEKEKTKYELERILENQNFADLQLQRTEYYFNQAIDSLTAARSELTSLQLPSNISADGNLRDIRSDIADAEKEIEDIKTKRVALLSEMKSLGLENMRLDHSDSIVELRASLDGQISAFAAMMEKYAWNEQSIISVNIRLNDKISKLEDQIDRAVSIQFASYPKNQQVLLKKYFAIEEKLDFQRLLRTRLQQSLDRLTTRINRLPRLLAEINELENKVAEARKYRDAFRSEEATVEILSERAKERTTYRVIEPARIPLTPFWPDRKKVLAMGVMLGLLLGGVSVFLVEIFDDSFKKKEDVERELGLPVLATIPRIERLKTLRR